MPNRYIICFEFRGDAFFGSQIQPEKRTVQGEIEKALCTLTKDKIKIFPSGRTDAKVSAKYQCAHFDTVLIIENTQNFLYKLNCILPDDLKVFELKKTKPDFHAQKDAKYKHYRYTIENNHVASVFSNGSLFYPYCTLNIEKMNLALSKIVGHHDFSAFKSKSDNPYSDCIIYYAKAKRVERDNVNYILVDIIGNRFLYNMVRIIVATLLMIERKNLDPCYLDEILKSKQRFKAPAPAPALALRLEYVGYDDVNEYIQKFIKEGK